MEILSGESLLYDSMHLLFQKHSVVINVSDTKQTEDVDDDKDLSIRYFISKNQQKNLTSWIY